MTESPWEGQDSWRIISSDKERKLESIESKLEERMRERIVALEFNPAVDLDGEFCYDPACALAHILFLQNHGFECLPLFL